MDWREASISGHVNPGWEPLVDELHRRVLEIDPDVEVEQVKEKFGGLGYYAASSTPNLVPEKILRGGFIYDNQNQERVIEIINRLIDEAEIVSRWTCEVCGNPGFCGSHGRDWLNTLCPEHSARRRTEDIPAWQMAEELRQGTT